MPNVVVLDKDVADKIAAGEVIERPASVVKELVENSIDAGATRIEVELEEGGKRRIQVADNGCGMVLEDAVLALERHATSKIRCAEDLYSVRTLGFRGEALPSIAAVATLRILTCAGEEEGGFELLVERGAVAAAEARGAPRGTRVTVTDLFANVPARLKFLKSEQTELAYILDLTVRFALSHPDIQFRLSHNGRPLFISPASGDAFNTLVAAYGREVAREMLPVRSPEDAPVSVSGFVSRPSVTRAGRTHQSFFVNGRLVRSPVLSRALDEAVKGCVPQGRHPVACLFVRLDPASVDVNVHPTKMEVRFADDRLVFNVVTRAVRSALEAANLAPPALAPEGGRARPRAVEQSIAAQSAGYDPFSGDVAREAAPTLAYRPATPPPTESPGFGLDRPRAPLSQRALSLDGPEPAPPPAGTDEDFAPPASAGDAALPELSPVARVLDTYVVCESGDAVYLIDQHAAHERILYDRLMARGGPDSAPQPLLVPQTLSLSHAEAAALEAHRETLATLGFEIEPFGRQTYVLRSVPALLVGRDYARVLRDVLDDLRELDHTGRLEEERAQVCALVACHSVTRSGDALAPEEMQQLVRDLRASPAPYTCAHGRPTMLVLSRRELERRMGRA